MHLACSPDYLPGPLFWAIALRCERVTLLTGRQYVRQSFHNRARVRGSERPQWLTIPIRRGQLGRAIARTGIVPGSDWPRHHVKALRFNYGSTPYYEHYGPQLNAALLDHLPRDPAGAVTLGGGAEKRPSSEDAEQVLSLVSVPLIRLIAGWLGVSATIEVHDGVDVHPGLRGEGGTEHVARLVLPPYRQAFEGFIPGLSVIDLLMNHGPTAVPMLGLSTQVRGDGQQPESGTAGQPVTPSSSVSIA